MPARVGDESVAFAHDELTPGSRSIDEIVFRRIHLAELPELPDPQEPARFRGLGPALFDAVASQISDVEFLLVVSIPEARHISLYGAAYRTDRTVVPLCFDMADLGAQLRELAENRPMQLRTSGNGEVSAGFGAGLANPADDPMAWLGRNIPNRWQAVADEPLKQQMLADARAANPRRVAVAPEAAVAAWRDLVASAAVTAAEPATPDELARLESVLGFELPDELRTVLSESDGAADLFGTGVVFLGCDGIVRVWRMWKDVFDDWPLAHLLDLYSCPTGEAMGMYTNPFWIPLVDERTGNYAMLDMAPGPDGAAGQIIYAGSEESHRIRVLAPDLATFLERQREHIESWNGGEPAGAFFWHLQ